MTWGWGIIDNRISFIFEQDGKTIKTHSNNPEDFYIVDYEGIYASDYEFITASAPHFDGAFTERHRVLPRYITITIDCEQSNRDFVLRFFKPKHTGRLTVLINDTARQIYYNVDRFKILTTNAYRNPMRFTVRLFCADPYFQAIDDFGQDIAAVMPLEAFPWVEEVGMDILSDYRVFSSQTIINNNGDIPIGLRIEFLARGQVQNPFIIMEDGQKLKVITDMSPGDLLHMNTIPGSKSIMLNDANIIHKIDRSSKFTQLAPGRNLLTYGADIGLQHLHVRLFFRPLFLGV